MGKRIKENLNFKFVIISVSYSKLGAEASAIVVEKSFGNLFYVLRDNAETREKYQSSCAIKLLTKLI